MRATTATTAPKMMGIIELLPSCWPLMLSAPLSTFGDEGGEAFGAGGGDDRGEGGGEANTHELSCSQGRVKPKALIQSRHV